jgi:hypothetical protein
VTRETSLNDCQLPPHRPLSGSTREQRGRRSGQECVKIVARVAWAAATDHTSAPTARRKYCPRTTRARGPVSLSTRARAALLTDTQTLTPGTRIVNRTISTTDTMATYATYYSQVHPASHTRHWYG